MSFCCLPALGTHWGADRSLEVYRSIYRLARQEASDGCIKSEASAGHGGQRMVQVSERSVNKAILVGRLGADAETRFTQNGTPVSRVSLAMNRQWTDSDKQVHEETDWMSIVIWNMENLAAYLTKGTKLS